MQLLYLAIAVCSFVIPFLFLSFDRWHQNRKNKRAPFTDKFLRSPGQSLNDKIQAVSEDITVYSGLVMFLPLCLISVSFILLYPEIENLILLEAVVIIAVFEFIFFIKLWKSLNRRNLLRLGYDGEVAVGQELNLLMLDGYHVFHDFLTDKFNIDHIIVGSSGVYAVETKAKRKSKKGADSGKVNYDGSSIQFPEYADYSAINQAIRQANWLRNWLSSAVGDKVDVEPVVVLPGWYVNRTGKNGIAVLNPKMVGVYLTNKKDKPLSDSMVRRIVHQLDQKCRDVDPVTIKMQVEAG